MLVSLAREGEKAAFEQLVVRRQAQVRGLLNRLCQDRSLADDLAQQSFLQAFLKITKLKDEKAFGAWLKRLSINVWLQHCRKRDLLESNDEAEEQAITPTPAERRDLDSALAELKTTERICIVLSYQEAMSHNDIAEVTQMPLGTVKSHIKRGTERLKVLLDDYSDGS